MGVGEGGVGGGGGMRGVWGDKCLGIGNRVGMGRRGRREVGRGVE